ncbi:MAG: DUF4175 domain-containing protein [Deltaproteobacteria bacterium]|nr:DUF4175 domain-containing protein [Deltaproteobacteria bacterium]
MPPRLAHLAAIWRSRVGPAQRSAWFTLLVAATFVGAHIARAGTWTARACVAGALAAVVLVWIARALWSFAVWRNPGRVAKRVISRVDRDLAERTDRALRLADRSAPNDDPVTRALAHLHLDSLLARVGHERLEDRAGAASVRWLVLAALLLATSMVAVVLGPLRVIEGLDVLIARHGRAPVPITWVEEIQGEVQVPRYLRQENASFLGYGRTQQPRGSVVSVRAAPLHPDRKLVLTDGTTEVPFVDDAHGAMIARWTLTDSVTLQIGARFGEVLIAQSDSLELVSIPDEAPKVGVDGAPRTLRLLEVSDIEVRYEVTDDHGLTEIDLVLKAGDREDRRVLAKLDGQTMFERGSAVVRPNDRFVKKAFVPVEITVEARDNDPITGPKWGRSAAITVIPPAVGEAEARRYKALKDVLGGAVDLLAKRIDHETPADKKDRATHVDLEQADHKALQSDVTRVVGEAFGGLKVPRSFGTLVIGRLERISAAIEAERKAATVEQAKAAHDKTRTATEDAVLAFDSALHMVANVDATTNARRLADAAEEVASGAKQARGSERERGLTRLKASMGVLQSGAEWISKLGALGKDLGEVILIGTRRVQRSVDAGELDHAELAARDLAMRLRRPLPSFSGGGGRKSTEAGTSTQGQDGEGENAQLDKARQEIDKIAKEHGDEMKQLEDELLKAMRDENLDELRQQGREHARAVREAVRSLPSSAYDSSSAEGAAAMAKEGAHSMADALESGNLPEAVARGRNALRALEQARRLAAQQHDFFGDPMNLGGELDAAKAKVEREQKWAEQQLEAQRKVMAEKARGNLERSAGAEERFAQRTGEVSRKGKSTDAPMPKAMLDLLESAEKAMKESSKALKNSEVDRGTEQQREAQRLLEMAREVQGSEEQNRERGDSDNDAERGDVTGGRVDIPKAEDFRGPEAFRKRVIEGLSRSRDPRLQQAVRRYAEGLLR